jgi:glycosyltransferase involved in cell wall biosynthesis
VKLRESIPVKHLIVIPAYNEEAALPRTLTLLDSMLPETYEVLVVNDGSKDGTGEAAEAFAARSRLAVHVLHLPVNGGIGIAVQTGYLFAEKMGGYQFVIQFDADGQHDAAALMELVAAAERDGLDLCIGSRFLQPGQGFQSTPARRLGIRFFAWLILVLGGQRLTDPTSGLRLAGPRAWKRFARHYPEDYPEPETLYWCVRNKLRVGEIPVRMHARQGGVSSIGVGQSVYYMLKVTLAILLDRLRGRNA